jgi:carotenoid cleavage dioxygenase
MNAQEKNTYLSGNFAPALEEVNEACNSVTGEFPLDLTGHYLRVGPNPQFEPLDEAKYHWFDGDGMIHHLDISNGRAEYKNRWIHTKGFNLEREEGKSIWKGFQSLHELEVHHGLMTKNVANTALVWHAQKLLALWEAGSPHSLSMPSLETLGEETFNGSWTGAFTAHPVICPQTDEMVAFAYNVIGDFGVTYGVFDEKAKLIHKADIKLKGKPVMIHDCAITPDYTLIIDMPVTFSLERAMAGEAAFAWEPDNGARIGVIPRKGNNEEVKWFDVELGYIFHVINAWQEGDEVILEACRSNCTSIISENAGNDQYTLEDEQAKPHQYRMNLQTGEVSECAIDDVAVEFSRINEAYVGVKNKYAYASRFSPNSNAPRFDALIKFDRKSNTKEIYAFDEGVYSGEFVFAAKDNAKEEDEGYLLGFVQDEKQQQSEFYIIDAQHFSTGPVAKIRMQHRVPYGFHGVWIPKNKLLASKISANKEFV